MFCERTCRQRSPVEDRRHSERSKKNAGQRLPPTLPLNVDLLGNTQRVFKFDTEVANRAVHLCMTKQKLDCA